MSKQQQRWWCAALACATLCVAAAGCAQDPADQLLALELEQAHILIDYRHDCEAMTFRMRRFLQTNGETMRSLYAAAQRRGETFQADDPRYSPEVKALLKRAHAARKTCQGQAASPNGPIYTPQFVELL